MTDTVPMLNGKPLDMLWNVHDPDGEPVTADLRVVPQQIRIIRGGVARVLLIETPRAELEVVVSRGGSVRVFDRKRQGWPELKPRRRRPRLPYRAAHLRARAEQALDAAQGAETRRDWDAVTDALDLAEMLRCGAEAIEALG